MIATILLISNGVKDNLKKKKNNIWCWNKEILLCLFC